MQGENNELINSSRIFHAWPSTYNPESVLSVTENQDCLNPIFAYSGSDDINICKKVIVKPPTNLHGREWKTLARSQNQTKTLSIEQHKEVKNS